MPKQTDVVCVKAMGAPARWLQERFRPQISHSVSSTTDRCTLYQHRNAASCNVLMNSLHCMLAGIVVCCPLLILLMPFSTLTCTQLLLTSTLAIPCVHAGYNAAITIPAGVHSIVIREDPLNTNNYFGRYTVVSQESTLHSANMCSTVLCWLEGKSHLQHLIAQMGACTFLISTKHGCSK